MGETIVLAEKAESIFEGKSLTLEERITSLIDHWELESSLIEERLSALADLGEDELTFDELEDIEKQIRTLRKMLRRYRNG